MSRGQGRVYRPKVRRADGARHETAVWWLDYSVRGVRHQESSHTTKKKAAVDLLAERLGDRKAGKLVGPSPDRVTFANLQTLVERQYELEGRRTLARMKQLFAHLGAFFGVKDEMGDHSDRAVDITPDRLDEYATRRLAQGAARATVNRELAAIRRGFRLALEKGVLAVMPRIRIPKEANARTGFFEPDDFAAVLAELPAYLRPAIECAYLTGWRVPSEILRLTWANVDFDGGVVRLDVGTTKNGEGRTFPFRMLPDLEALIKRQRDRRDGLFVFHLRGQPIRDFYASWRSAVRRAAVKRHENGLDEVVRPQLVGRIPHDLRRTAVRNLVRAGVPEKTAMLLTGHKTRSVFDRYDIVNEQDLSDAVAKLAARQGSSGKQAGNIPTPASSPALVSSSVA
jgi:integrase